jgi:hypothetical protein
LRAEARKIKNCKRLTGIMNLDDMQVIIMWRDEGS